MTLLILILRRCAPAVVPLACALAFSVSSNAMPQVTGDVRDALTNMPLAGARVSVQASNAPVMTDAQGGFTLPNAAGANLVVVGALKGYYNGSATVSAPVSGVSIVLETSHGGQQCGYTLASPTSCGLCHPNQYGQWANSPMQKAGMNTWVYDIYDGTGTAGGLGGFVYTRDSVHALHNPQSECASCHQPQPWIEQPFTAMEPLNALSQGAFHGVSCDVCHKVADIDEAKVDFPGIYPGVVTFNRPDDPLATHQVQYGNLGDSSVHLAGVMRSSYQPQLTAAVCAACHQDKNDPDGDGDFDEPNGVLSEPTYGEWLASDYANPASPHYATCTTCHMPAYGETRAAQFGNLAPLRDPETIRSHAIVGTTPEFLESAVELTVDLARDANGIDVVATVANTGTGHHVPTGVTVRNMILLVEARRVSDGALLTHVGGQTVHALGGVGSPQQGYYAGLPGKLYAKVNHDAAGNSPTFFTDATGIQFDSRIPALTEDVTQYRFATPPGTGDVAVSAKLVYRRAWRFLVDAKQWTTDGHGNPLADVQAPHYGHVMESLDATVPEQVGPGAAYCMSDANSTGAPALVSATGSASVAANDLVLVASNVPPATHGLFFLGTQSALRPLGNGTLCVGGAMRRFPTFGPTASTIVQQQAAAVFGTPGFQVQPGTTLHFQCWFRDTAVPGAGLDLSDAYQVTFVP
jgi:hypothetical protein